MNCYVSRIGRLFENGELQMLENFKVDQTKWLGYGSFGLVLRVSRDLAEVDEKIFTGALKMVNNEDSNQYQNIKKELKLMELTADGADASNVIKLVGHFPSLRHDCHCLVFPLYGPAVDTMLFKVRDLVKAAKAKKQELLHARTVFSLNSILTVFKQIVKALMYLQTKRIAHCDIKLNNILFVHPNPEDFSDLPPKNCAIKLIDLGKARVYEFGRINHYDSDNLPHQYADQAPESVFLRQFCPVKSDVFTVALVTLLMYEARDIFPSLRNGKYVNRGTDFNRRLHAQYFELFLGSYQPYTLPEGSWSVMNEITHEVTYGRLTRCDPLDDYVRPNEKNWISTTKFFMLLRKMLTVDYEKRPTFHHISTYEFFCDIEDPTPSPPTPVLSKLPFPPGVARPRKIPARSYSCSDLREAPTCVKAESLKALSLLNLNELQMIKPKDKNRCIKGLVSRISTAFKKGYRRLTGQ